MSKDAAEWHHAMCKEMNSLKNNSMWWAVYLLSGCCAIGLCWVFKIKHLLDVAINHFKAQVVAQSFSQHPGIDFTKTFAPTAHWAAVCTVLALAAIDNMHLESVNVSSAFLYGDIDAELYIKFLKSFSKEVPSDI